jgi:hypothetical protein
MNSDGDIVRNSDYSVPDSVLHQSSVVQHYPQSCPILLWVPPKMTVASLSINSKVVSPQHDFFPTAHPLRPSLDSDPGLLPTSD